MPGLKLIHVSEIGPMGKMAGEIIRGSYRKRENVKDEESGIKKKTIVPNPAYHMM